MTTLIVVGAFIELVGIVLVASPDLVPGALRLAAWARPRWRMIENRLRRLLGLPLRGIVHEVGAASEMSMTGSATGYTSINPDATLEEKVAFLLRRDREAQTHEANLAQRLTAIEQNAPKQLDELRSELESHVTRQITKARADYRAARIFGTVVLVIGLALSTAGNLIN